MVFGILSNKKIVDIFSVFFLLIQIKYFFVIIFSNVLIKFFVSFVNNHFVNFLQINVNNAKFI